MQNKVVTEFDFRKEEFKDAVVEDYEFDSGGELVRKDRFEKSVRAIAEALGMDFRAGWKCSEVVACTEVLVELMDKINDSGIPNLQCLAEEFKERLMIHGTTKWWDNAQ